MTILVLLSFTHIPVVAYLSLNDTKFKAVEQSIIILNNTFLWTSTNIKCKSIKFNLLKISFIFNVQWSLSHLFFVNYIQYWMLITLLKNRWKLTKNSLNRAKLNWMSFTQNKQRGIKGRKYLRRKQLFHWTIHCDNVKW